MSGSMSEREYLQRLASLPREMAPAEDVWRRIVVHISPAAAKPRSGRQRLRAWPFAVAACVLVAAAAGLLLDGWRTDTAGQPSTRSVAVWTGPYLPASRSVSELEYQAALREFMGLNEAADLAEVSPPKWVEQGWGTLRRVELALAEALKKDPDNEFLQSRLAALRARQIELLRQIAALDTFARNTI